MPSLKEVRTRIASVKSTQQITRAMKMVAASKLRKAQNSILQLRPYARKLYEILQNITASLETSGESIYSSRTEVKNVLLVVFTSNRGLCGAFNANVIKSVNNLIHTEYEQYNNQGSLKLVTIGKYATHYFTRRKFNVSASYDEVYDDLTFRAAADIAMKIMDDYVSRDYDKVILVYNQFKNPAVQKLVHEQFLPVATKESTEIMEAKIDFIFEPDKEEIIQELVPRSLKIQFYKALLDSFASEQGARMTAMHLATDNATELLKDLRMSYNKARQAAITRELIEIVSGAEALKG